MSSEKKILGPTTIIGSDPKWGDSKVSGDMSQLTITSKIIQQKNVDNICLEVAWTGVPVGTFQLFGSLTGQNWCPVSFSLPSAAGSAGSFLLDMNQLSFPLMKLVYTKGSGTGTLLAYAGGKEI